MCMPDEAGIKAPRGVLFCPRCGALILAQEGEMDMARAVAKRNGFKRGLLPLRELPERPKKGGLIRQMAAIEMFPQHPEYHRVPASKIRTKKAR